ncbi:preprotein translocase subunit SecG [Methylorubrum salsuginis]|uniref:Protein-export membrane protein SecG n=1 Tax=Methylorubrum salsuginis TaxID=414703 RepID=A0A1I4GEY2_9HYPH|nr:preprotein translocase subunit SecG [Methylorubrum salsuginis]SFL28622.1 preprotein translocase subunit SecG [Methylorubrum salsuginis]
MQTLLIVVHLIIVLALIAVVLLQRSEGGLGLGGGGSGGVSGFMTGRGQANALTRATAILAALFFTTSMALAIMAHRSAAPRSILDGAGQTQGQTQQPDKPVNADNLLDTLRQGSQNAPTNQPAAPAPSAPAPAAPAAPAESAPPAAPSAPEAPQSR